MRLRTLFAAAFGALVSATALAAPRDPLDYRYVAAYFDGGNTTGLRLAGSDDALEWVSIPAGFQPEVGDWKIFRDPSFARGPDGLFHLVWTAGSDGFGYARSRNLTDWEGARYVPVNRGPLEGELKYTWAPEVWFDQASGTFRVIVSVATRSWEGSGWRGNFASYMLETEDFESFSEPRLLFDPHPAFYDIDAALVEFQGQTYAFYKIEDADLTTPGKEKDGIHWATAPTADGPWTGYSSERLPGNKGNSEGPSPLVVDGALIVYYDLTPGMRAARSFDGQTWEDISDQLQAPADFRHGTMRQLKND